jgi:hypothetical protein
MQYICGGWERNVHQCFDLSALPVNVYHDARYFTMQAVSSFKERKKIPWILYVG